LSIARAKLRARRQYVRHWGKMFLRALLEGEDRVGMSGTALRTTPGGIGEMRRRLKQYKRRIAKRGGRRG
jgi:hypothetical protein